MRRGKRSRLRRLVRGTLPAGAVLLAIPLLALWHGRALGERTARWQGQIDEVERHIRAGEWDAARSALDAARADWSGARTWLQVTARHDELDRADALYGRCAALADGSDDFFMELSDLRRALADLAGRERLSIGNIF